MEAIVLRRLLQRFTSEPSDKKRILFPDAQQFVPGYRLRERLVTDDGERFLALDSRGYPFVVRLYRELGEERLARLRRSFLPIEHPNVAAFTDAGLGPGHGWLARPHLEGPCLEDFLSAGMLQPKEVLRLLLDLLDGLQALHAASILYDHWRPENVLWYQERWVLCDVGLQTPMDHRVGPIYPRVRHWAYLAPERIAGEIPTRKSDLYSLGALAGHAILGQPLFLDSDQAMKFFIKVLTEEPALKERCPEAPAPLLDALELLLRKQPEERDGLEVRALLEQKAPASRSHPEVETYLSHLREAGSRLEGGEFTLDPRKALEKLRDFQFPQPHHFLLPLLSGFVARGATHIRIETQKDKLLLTSDAAALSKKDIENLFLAATRRGDSLAHLGLALIGALGAGGDRLHLLSGGCKASVFRVCEQIEVVETRGGGGIRVEVQGHGLRPQAPPDLPTRLLFSQVAVTWNGQPLHGATRLPVWARQELEGEEFVIEGALEGARPGLYIRVEGLTYQLAGNFVLPEATVLLEGPWQLSLSYQAVRGDKRRQVLRRQATELLLEKAAEVALHSPIEPGRAEFYRAFLEHVEGDKLRALLDC